MALVEMIRSAIKKLEENNIPSEPYDGYYREFTEYMRQLSFEERIDLCSRIW